LPVNLSVSPNFHFQPLGKSIDDGDAHTVQAAGDAVGLMVELAARVEHGHDDLQSRSVILGMVVYRDAATVVFDGNASIHADGHLDLRAEALQGLIHTVINHFVHQMV